MCHEGSLEGKLGNDLVTIFEKVENRGNSLNLQNLKCLSGQMSKF